MVSEVGEKQCYKSQRRENVKKVDLINSDKCSRMVKKMKNFFSVMVIGPEWYFFLLNVILCSR